MGEDKDREGKIWVEGYTRSDGTEVEGYWREKKKGEKKSKDEISEKEKIMERLDDAYRKMQEDRLDKLHETIMSW